MRGTTKSITVNGREYSVYSDFINRNTVAVDTDGKRFVLRQNGYISNPATIKRAIKAVA